MPCIDIPGGGDQDAPVNPAEFWQTLERTRIERSRRTLYAISGGDTDGLEHPEISRGNESDLFELRAAQVAAVIRLLPRDYKRARRVLDRVDRFFYGLTYHARGRRFPPILINALPKSGSTYLAKSLRRVLRVGTESLLMHGFHSTGTIDAAAIERFALGNSVSHQHLPPEPHIVAALAMKVPRMVLHLRDPRAALVSRTHFVMQHHDEYSELRAIQALEQVPPRDYFERPFAGQLAWQVANHFPKNLAWISRWLAIAADPNSGLTVLITDYAEMTRDPAALLTRILEFNGIDAEPAWIRPRKPKPGQWKFRAGPSSDWREEYPPELLAEATEAIPADLRARFHWE